MNFKPTSWKSIISIVSFLIPSYVIYSGYDCVCEVLQPGEICGCQSALEAMFPFGFLISLIPLVVIYLIWSLFEKK